MSLEIGDSRHMATIYIDNRPYEVRDGQNLLQACLSLGFDIPYFCWHPALHSVGACRQCAVKQFRDENDTKGKIVMSCMTPATEGTRITIDDPEVKAFRAAVIEWLMTNHPHDCPVCDEGGECHLQDMTVMTGHAYRRFRFNKRTYRNQQLGPFINHEMNRCIQCYRCVRFYRDYAGGRDLDVFASHDHVYFGRHDDGVLENEFSGNLVEVCPTGVFTDKTFKRHFTRKWDLQTAPSVCVHCGLGCNTIAGERYGKLRRILNRYNHDVNGYFLCDRGRFGYEFVNGERRVTHPLMRASSARETTAVPAGKKAVLHRLTSLLHSGGGVIGIGSPRASLEANFMLRTLVGAGRFYAGVPKNEAGLLSGILGIIRRGPALSPSLQEVREADAVLILGEDITNTAPALSLAVRQALRRGPLERAAALQIPVWQDAAARTLIQDEAGPLFVATPAGTSLDDRAAGTFRGAPDDIARLGIAVAHEIDNSLPALAESGAEVLIMARAVAKALKEAKRPLVISGTGCGSISVIRAAADIAGALCKGGLGCDLCYTVPECNSLGLGLLAGGERGDELPKDLDDAYEAVRNGEAETVIILENDLFRRSASSEVSAFLEKAGHVVVMDHTSGGTSEMADLLIPSATFAESTGTFMNNEGRCQRFFQVFMPDSGISPAWRWLADLMRAAGRTEAKRLKDLDAITEALAETLPAFSRIREVAPDAGFRAAGMKIPRQPHRYSGRTSMHADVDVREERPPEDPDSALSFSMEGYEGLPPAALIQRYWSPGWNSVQAASRFQKEVGGQLTGGDPGLKIIGPTGIEKTAFFSDIPGAFQPRPGSLLIVSLYHIFGSEELSSLSPAISELTPAPYLALGRTEASRLGAAEGKKIEFTVSGITYHLPVRVVPGLPPGLGGIPSGLPGIEGIALPAWGTAGRTE